MPKFETWAEYPATTWRRVWTVIEAPTRERAIEILKGREKDDCAPTGGHCGWGFWDLAYSAGVSDDGPTEYDAREIK